MPELPEVETIRLALTKKLPGLTIKNIQVLNSKSFQADSKNILGKKILKIFRKAKVLGIELEDNITLLTHLKMSGQLIYQGKDRFIGGHPTRDMVGEMPNKSTRVIFDFKDGSKLFFNDQRKFGWIKLVKSDALLEQVLLKTLGPEPLEKEFTWQVLKENLLKHKTLPVKVALLDQKTVSGIGNIYASESLFLSKIDPRKKVIDLTDQNFKSLQKGIVESLKNGIKYGGSSKTHFLDPEGNKGLFLDYAYVYGREKKECKICKTKIEKITQAGRSTYLCPSCQCFSSPQH